MRLRYVIAEAFRNMGRNALVVLGAILAVFISLSLTFGTLVFGEIAKVNTAQWSDDVRVEAFISDDFRDVPGLQTEIEEWDEVAEVIFLSKPEAFQLAIELFADEPANLELIQEDPSIIPASFRIRPTELDNYDTVAARLAGTPGITDVISAGDTVNRFIAVRDALRFVFWILAIALGVAAVALIANTIHMAIYARREEIEIMKLVGASNWFVRTPFVLEGVIEGFLGGALAVGTAAVLYQVALDRLTDLPDFVTLDVGSAFLVQRGVAVVAFGVIVGAIGSVISLTVHRYVRT
ncbi:MAG: cell division protein FtsX [Acidimicrobiia bacterium]